MPAIDVLDGGMLTTVQDCGRVGFQKYGVPVSGAMDRFALRVGNRLVANDDTAAGLEMTLQGSEVAFPQGAVIAVTGADLSPRLNGRPMPGWRTVVASPGSTLAFGSARDGLRAYLAVHGGIDVPPVLGSRSTFTRSRLGGFEGRKLRAGDVLPTGLAGALAPPPIRMLPRALVPAYGHDHRLRVVPGPQDDGFTEEGVRTFLTSAYTLTPQSDRIGCRLDGPPVQHLSGADIVSDGIVVGAVQVSGDRMPIVLMADCGTTGGYTKIATVITVDLPRMAQAVPGDRIRFEAVSVAFAQALLAAEERLLAALAAGALAEAAEPIYDEDASGPLAAEAYSELAAALQRTSGPRARGSGISSPVGGLVVSVAVGDGDAVAAGQEICVVEAMKMQNVVRAPRAGRIARVLAAPGAVVAAHATLAEYGDSGS